MLIGYARVSRDKQETALQLDALDKAGCQRVYVEKLSGASPERPELERCLDTLREGDTLIVWHLDRLGRSIKDLGALVFHVFAALAEYERARLQERTRAGLEAARARGRRGGRPLAMSDEDARKARAMLSDVEITKAEVAKHFGVSRPTLNAALARLSPSDT
ncbi:recombinase family protein [Salmonella enterica]|nr:recombinase family protein [Salmonella enterica]